MFGQDCSTILRLQQENAILREKNTRLEMENTMLRHREIAKDRRPSLSEASLREDLNLLMDYLGVKIETCNKRVVKKDG